MREANAFVSGHRRRGGAQQAGLRSDRRPLVGGAAAAPREALGAGGGRCPPPAAVKRRAPCRVRVLAGGGGLPVACPAAGRALPRGAPQHAVLLQHQVLRPEDRGAAPAAVLRHGVQALEEEPPDDGEPGVPALPGVLLVWRG